MGRNPEPAFVGPLIGGLDRSAGGRLVEFSLGVMLATYAAGVAAAVVAYAMSHLNYGLRIL
jgi:tetrahydromethanopterin S-methyltransferase subunit D